jgi:hypothetical protein
MPDTPTSPQDERSYEELAMVSLVKADQERNNDIARNHILVAQVFATLYLAEVNSKTGEKNEE